MNSGFQFPSDRTFVIAEIGINHNGSLDLAKQLIDVAADAGCDAVKFQKRTPRMALPPHLWDQMRDTPWGERMTYIEYRERIELSHGDYQSITAYCAEKNILFSASPWDLHAANAVYTYGAPFIKIASATLTNLELLRHIATMGRAVVMSTGMTDYQDVKKAVSIFRGRVPHLGILACTSKYPAPVEQLHLNRIHTLKDEFPEAVIGYSGHEPGLWTTLCAVAMGAQIIERHITLDRTMKGSDQAASIEPQGLKKLVHEIRQFEKAKGSGNIGVLECELSEIKRLRGVEYKPNGATQCVL